MKKPAQPKRHPTTGRFLSRADWAWAQRETKARGGTKAQKRHQTVTAAFKERGSRTRVKGKLRPEYRQHAKPVVKKSGGKGWRKTVTTYRVTPSSAGLARVADQILSVPGRAKVQVQVGTSLAKGASWAGTRLTDKRDASAWLQGMGKNYSQRFNPREKTKAVVVEVISIQRVKAKKARKKK